MRKKIKTLISIFLKKNGFTYQLPSEEIVSMSTRKDKAVVVLPNIHLMYFDLKDSKKSFDSMKENLALHIHIGGIFHKISKLVRQNMMG